MPVRRSGRTVRGKGSRTGRGTKRPPSSTGMPGDAPYPPKNDPTRVINDRAAKRGAAKRRKKK